MWGSESGAKLKRKVVTAEQLDATIADLAIKPDQPLNMIYTHQTRFAWIDGLGGKQRPGVLETTELYPDYKYERMSAFLDQIRQKAVSQYDQRVRDLDPIKISDPLIVTAGPRPACPRDRGPVTPCRAPT